MINIDALPIEKQLELNAKLQAKKQALRLKLAETNVQKDKSNDFDGYSYLSEAGYKKLFSELFPAFGLELTASNGDVEKIQTGHGRMPNGLLVDWMFILTDTETGFYEESCVTAEGWDKGDKAIYKAHTGALKYYLANTFMVAAGDDAEKDSEPFVPEVQWATKEQIEYLNSIYTGQSKNAVLQKLQINAFDQLSADKAEWLINQCRQKQNGRRAK